MIVIERGWAVVLKDRHTSGDGQILLSSGEMSRVAYDYGSRCDDLAMPPPPKDGLWVWEGEIVDDGREFVFQNDSYRPATPMDLGAFWPEWWAEEKEGETLRGRMADLLTRTANVLKGEPPPLTRHSWHDLPEAAQAITKALELAVIKADEARRMARPIRGSHACARCGGEGVEPDHA